MSKNRSNPKYLQEPKSFNFDKCIESLNNKAVKFQQKKQMDAGQLNKFATKRETATSGFIQKSPQKVQFESILPDLEGSRQARQTHRLPNIPEEDPADILPFKQSSTNPLKHRYSSATNEDVDKTNNKDKTFKDKTMKSYKHDIPEMKFDHLDDNFDLVEMRSNQYNFDQSKNTLILSKPFDTGRNTISPEINMSQILRRVNEEEDQRQLLQSKEETQEEFFDPKNGIVFVVPVVSKPLIHDLMLKKRIVEIPFAYINRYKPKNDYDLVTNDIKASLNLILFTNILDYVKILFNNFKVQGYNFKNPTHSKGPNDFFFNKLVSFDNKPIEDLIFNVGEHNIIFAIPQDGCMEGLPAQTEDPDQIYNYYLQMKEFHDFRDVEITSQDLLKIIANKHNLDATAIENQNPKTKSSRTEELPNIQLKKNFTTVDQTKMHEPLRKKQYENTIAFDQVDDKREQPPRFVKTELNPDRSKTMIIAKKTYDRKYQPDNSKFRSKNSTTNKTENNLMSTMPTRTSVKKVKTVANEDSKNMTSHKLQELSLQYDMSRREIYEMHSTWYSMLEFTANYLSRQGYNGNHHLFTGKNSMHVVNSMLDMLSTKSDAYQAKIIKSLKINMVSPDLFKLISWEDYIRLFLIFKENDLYSTWKIDFWCSFFDNYNRGFTTNADFEQTCAYLSEQSKKTDEFLHEKTTNHFKEMLKEQIDEKQILNILEMRKAIERKEINLVQFVKQLKGEISILKN